MQRRPSGARERSKPSSSPPEDAPAPASSREAFRGNYLRLEIETWPTGDWEIVRHPGACAVVAITKEGDILLVRQFRPALRSKTLEVPAGLLDVEGESPRDCAVRELVEETGHEAHDVRSLGSFLTSPGMTDERFHLYRADATPIPDSAGEEGIQIVRMPFGRAVEQASSGELQDVKTVLAILLAAREDEPGATVPR
ncbi:MAG: NUDIX hydrolase [Actinomycetota bacterium]